MMQDCFMRRSRLLSTDSRLSAAARQIRCKTAISLSLAIIYKVEIR